jgi:hypothetical protein
MSVFGSSSGGLSGVVESLVLPRSPPVCRWKIFLVQIAPSTILGMQGKLGARLNAFEACLGFTHVAALPACWPAQSEHLSPETWQTKRADKIDTRTSGRCAPILWRTITTSSPDDFMFVARSTPGTLFRMRPRPY